MVNSMLQETLQMADAEVLAECTQRTAEFNSKTREEKLKLIEKSEGANLVLRGLLKEAHKKDTTGSNQATKKSNRK